MSEFADHNSSVYEEYIHYLDEEDPNDGLSVWPDEEVDHPPYYGGKDNLYEAINVIEAWKLNFHCGNVVKYIARHKEKNNAKQDIEKAIWYLQRYLETLEG